MVETHLKDNYIDWLPVKKGEALLCVEEQLENLEGTWDYLVVSDAFAKAKCQMELLKRLKEHLNPGGHIILAVDNRYGLTYFAGSKERLTGKYFEGLEGYGGSDGICTFSKDAVLSFVKEAGFGDVKTYYPYPNYRYMTALYTDEKLPSPGDLNCSLCNFEEERAVLFNESAVFDGLIKEGKFQEFSNSYLFDLTVEKQEREEELLFLKYSVERDEKYRIRTEIVRKADGTKVVRKVPYTEAAKAHVEKIKHWEEVLKLRYKSAGISVNRCTFTEKGAEFEFLKGETLEDVLDDYLAKDDLAGFITEIQNYVKKLEQIADPKVNNVDLIFSNIIINDGKWNVIDYEWTFEADIPLKFIVHRAIVLYCEHKKQKSLQSGDICRMIGITEGEQQQFLAWEHELQLHLLGNTKTMAALQHEYAGKVIELKEILYRAHQPEMKIYQDFGQGLSEENSYVLEVPEDFYGRRRFTLNLPQGVVAIRLDPCEEPCQVTVNRILGECGGSYEPVIGHNGKGYEKSILYTTTDPQILISEIVPGTSQIHVDVTIEYLKEETSYVWMKLLEKAEKCDRIEASKPYRLMKKIKNILKKG